MLLSTIHEVSSVGIRRAKNQSSSSQRQLRVCTKNEVFHQRSKGGDLKKSEFSSLGGVIETSFGSTMLQEVGILPTLVYSYFLWTDFYLRGCLAIFLALGIVWHNLVTILW